MWRGKSKRKRKLPSGKSNAARSERRSSIEATGTSSKDVLESADIKLVASSSSSSGTVLAVKSISSDDREIFLNDYPVFLDSVASSSAPSEPVLEVLPLVSGVKESSSSDFLAVSSASLQPVASSSSSNGSALDFNRVDQMEEKLLIGDDLPTDCSKKFSCFRLLRKGFQGAAGAMSRVYNLFRKNPVTDYVVENPKKVIFVALATGFTYLYLTQADEPVKMQLSDPYNKLCLRSKCISPSPEQVQLVHKIIEYLNIKYEHSNPFLLNDWKIYTFPQCPEWFTLNVRYWIKDAPKYRSMTMISKVFASDGKGSFYWVPFSSPNEYYYRCPNFREIFHGED